MKNKFSLLFVGLLCAVSVACAGDKPNAIVSFNESTVLRQRSTGTTIDIVNNDHSTITLLDGTVLSNEEYFNRYVSPSNVPGNNSSNNTQMKQLKQMLCKYFAENENKKEYIFITPERFAAAKSEFTSLDLEKIQKAYAYLSEIKNSAVVQLCAEQLIGLQNAKVVLDECAENLDKREEMLQDYSATLQNLAIHIGQAAKAGSKEIQGLEKENEELKKQIAILTAMMQNTDSNNVQDTLLGKNEEAADFYEDGCCCTIL